jgi:hypothetical protein
MNQPNFAAVLEKRTQKPNKLNQTIIKKNILMPWRRGTEVITSAYRTEDPGFESRQGVR